MSSAPNLPEESGIWYTLWTATKLLLVLVIAAVVAIFMLTSTQPTVTPAATLATTPTVVVGTPTAGPTTTSVPTPIVPTDALVPGHLIYVQGRTLYSIHEYDAPQELAPGSGVGEPAISPSGRQVAYIRFHKNFQDLFVLDLRTGKSTKILNDDLTDLTDPRTGLTASTPAWSNDGATLYFSWNYPGFNNGNVTDLSIFSCPSTALCNGQSATQLRDPNPTNFAGGDYQPVPRPADPTMLLYTKYIYQTYGNDEHDLSQIIAHNLTGDTEISLTPWDPNNPQPVSLSQPAWNPTGRLMAFVKTSGDSAQQTSIYSMAFHPPGDAQDYAHAKLLVAGAPFAANPVFSPDGHYLAYIATSPDDGRLHLFIGRVQLGRHANLTHVEMVKRAGIVDGDHLTWTR